MKKYIILAMILMAGISVYPQATRTARETKTEKGNNQKESVRQTNTNSVQKANRAQKQTYTRTDPPIQKQNRTQAEPVTRTKTQASVNRVARPSDPQPVKVNNSSANRVYRQEKGSLIRDDGSVVTHQNDQIFTRNRTRNYSGNYETVRGSDDFRQAYRDYNNWYDYRTIRVMRSNPRYRPASVEIRREHNVYRQPMHYSLIWTPDLFNEFMFFYPDYTDWNIEFGNEIETISSYDVLNYVGTVKRVYGRVEEVYFSKEDNNYILYLGARFPYQDLSVIIPRPVMLTITGTPDWYFGNQYIWLVGLIDLWQDSPEIVIRDEEQIRKY